MNNVDPPIDVHSMLNALTSDNIYSGDGQVLSQALFIGEPEIGPVQESYYETFQPGLHESMYADMGTSPIDQPPSQPIINEIRDADVQTTPIETHDANVQFSNEEAAVDKSNVSTQTKPPRPPPPKINAPPPNAPPLPNASGFPILENSSDYVRGINSMKNRMIHQLMNDNILMLKAQIDSRRKALHEMERLFNITSSEQGTTESPYTDKSLEMLSHMVKIKDDFIHQLLRENVSYHPPIYNLIQMLKDL